MVVREAFPYSGDLMPKARFQAASKWGCSHPEVRLAAQNAVEEFGPHSGGSEPNIGTHFLVEKVQSELSHLTQKQYFTFFPTGWGAGYGALRGLLRQGDYVLMDRFSHNCLVEGAQNSGSNVLFFAHNNLGDLSLRLERLRKKAPEATVLVVTEAVFSADSDGPDLQEFASICQRFETNSLVDVAHDLGALGPGGTGQIGAAQCADKIDFIMGSFTKTFCSNGGFVATNAASADIAMKSYGNSNTFSNALSPTELSTILACLKIIRSPEGDK